MISDPPITPQESEIARVHVELMCEIRDRLRAVDRSRRPQFSKPMFDQEYLAAEFGMLQLRMVCELVAFACVSAHGDIPITRTGKFKKDYSADLIFRNLEHYRPGFFPEAVKSVGPFDCPDLQPREGAMTRGELVKLYRYCLDRLHRGRVQDILEWNRREYDYRYLGESINKLLWLLDQHTITLLRDDGRRAWVQMDVNGKVRWLWMFDEGQLDR
jgi:hypothetical protein